MSKRLAWVRARGRAAPPKLGGKRALVGRLAYVWAALLWVLASCLATPAARAQPALASPGVAKIVGGSLERGRDAVVFVTEPGGRCTGALIGHRLVLTAKHCVQAPFETEPTDAAEISVGIGYDATSPEMMFYRVADVVVVGGAYTQSDAEGVQALLPDDIAILTLQHAPGVPPLALNFEEPEGFVGTVGTAVGFGQTPSHALGGVKMTVDTEVQYVDEDSLFVGSAVCPGDSGGPLIGPDDRVMGVVSQGLGEECGVGVGFYNRIDLHEDFIMQAFARAGEVPGECLETGPEVCDGFDNDCDEEIDEGCLALGSSCSADSECIGGLCADTPMGKLCAASCDPLRPALACPDGLRCINTGECEGLCVPGSVGGKAFEEKCEQDNECASLFCADPGDGTKRCLGACRSGTDGCFSDEACVARDGECGPCAGARLVSGGLGFGEPCDDAGRCRSGMCIEDGELEYCSDTCAGPEDCSVSAHCRGGVCVRGQRAALGGRCLSMDDCVAELFCTGADGSEGFCTLQCESEADCGAGFECAAVANGKACVPVRRVLGQRCEADDECISNLCDQPSGRCSRACAQNAACGSGFQCVRRKALAEGVCLSGADEPGESGGGGGCAAGTAGSVGLSWGLFGLVLALRRRRAGRLRAP